MKSIHYFSGLIIALFVGLHLLNHALILRSSEAHISFMNTFRVIYRNPIVEAILLGALLIQIATGIFLVYSKWNAANSLFEWLQIASGLYMSVFLIIHVSAVLIGRYKLSLDTNLYFGIGYMNVSPQRFFFIPYYSLAVISFFLHIACIHHAKISKYVELNTAQNQAIAIIAFGAIFTAAVITKMSSINIRHATFKRTETPTSINQIKFTMEALKKKIFEISVSIRYVAIYSSDKLISSQRSDLENASSSESDKYEELIVNPTLLKLVTQRGNIDCGGMNYVIIRYGSFYEFVMPTNKGHVSVGIEPNSELMNTVFAIESLVLQESN